MSREEEHEKKEVRDCRIILQLQKLVKAQDRLLITYRTGSNPGSAPENAKDARAALKKIGFNL